jgi:GntR family histidine utilization transcriptional repressor
VQLEDRYVNPRQVPQFAAQDFTLLQPSEYLVRNVCPSTRSSMWSMP